MNILNLKSQKMIVNGEIVVITSNTIKKTCKHFADNAIACIEEVKQGLFVNDPDKYCAERIKDHDNYLSGNFKPWLGFWQQALYIQTGNSVPILSQSRD